MGILLSLSKLLQILISNKPKSVWNGAFNDGAQFHIHFCWLRRHAALRDTVATRIEFT